ncbi:MAG TPA: P-loop NTPase fold protein, partial [Blastocatellia bacterium]
IARAYAPGELVFVLIDDLDRCEVPKAADLMQALNLMLSEHKTLIFIIGMDRQKVAAGLAVKYEKLLPYIYPSTPASTNGGETSVNPSPGIEFGYEFIEKFIQLPFPVPQASVQDIDRLLSSLNGEVPTGGMPAPENPDIVEIVDGENESPEFRDIVLLAAPCFDYNPRRIKQFVNTLRLRTHVASATGLFALPHFGSLFAPLTIQRLGKFVALTLRWPLLVADLHSDRTLLHRLQMVAWGALDPEKDALLKYWSGKPKLIQLLRAGFTGKLWEDEEDSELRPPPPERDPERLKYGLTDLDIDKLLGISPAKVRVAGRNPGDPRNEAERVRHRSAGMKTEGTGGGSTAQESPRSASPSTGDGNGRSSDFDFSESEPESQSAQANGGAKGEGTRASGSSSSGNARRREASKSAASERLTRMSQTRKKK